MSFSLVFSYELKESDYNKIDKIEIKLYNKIDKNPNISVDKVISLIENILEKRKLTPRVEYILQIIVEDLKVDYLSDGPSYDDVDLGAEYIDEDFDGNSSFDYNDEPEDEYNE